MNIVQYITNNGNMENLDGKAGAYIKIFGEEPRNEGYECKNLQCDKKYYALSEIEKTEILNCLSCGEPLEKVYDQEQLKQQRKEWEIKKGYIEYLAHINKEIIGFILGRQDSLFSLNYDKLKLDTTSLQTLENTIKKLYLNFSPDEVFYFSEIGLEKEYRSSQEHIASNLYNLLETQVKNTGNNCILLRTTQKSPMPYERYKKLGYQVVYQYNNDPNERVLMIKPL